MKIEVKSTELVERAITTKRGEPATLREQTLWIHNGEAYPERARLTLNRDQQPFAPGFYTLSPRCFRIGRFGELSVNLAFMVPAK